MRSLIIPIMLALLVVACVPVDQARVPTGEVVRDVPVEVPALDEPAAPEQFAGPAIETPPVTPDRFTVEAVEGDLIQLRPEALDPDGDKVSFTFTKPFNTEGQWQTQIGDEGTYEVAIGASDGKSTTTETIVVVVLRANRPPVVDCREIIINEGEIVDLHKGCSVTDEDSAEVIVTYSGWMDGWRYQTGYDDAGTHYVTITASDKEPQTTGPPVFLHTVIENVTIVVRNTNRAPVFSDDFPALINAIENDVITLPTDMVTDPDKDPITITYSAPFTAGVWKTKIGDAGSYEVDVVASDGETSVKRTVTIKVGLLNTVPVLKSIPDITVKEGETIKLPISATDREGDKLTTTISGWMTGDTYKTTYEDAGSYTVKVTVTDGEFTATETVQITVQDVNRPPVFLNPA